MDLTGMTVTLGSIITITGIVLSILTYLNGRKKSNKEEEARLVKIEAMLVQIEKNTNNLNTRVDSHDKMLTKHETRISVIEAQIEQCPSHRTGGHK